MKKVILMVAAVGALGATQAFAQATAFEGWGVGVYGEQDFGSATATDGSSGTGNSLGLSLQGGYTWALGERFTLGLGATVATGNRNAGTYKSGAGTYSSNRMSLDVTPGYNLSKDVQLYGKLSSVTANVTSNDGSSTATVQGTGYGLGFKGLINRHLFWQAGVDNYNYGNASFSTGATTTVKDTVFSAGLGYKF
jgi:hypothetical protein